ncbi:unnamed protein product [Lampetra planeri]
MFTSDSCSISAATSASIADAFVNGYVADKGAPEQLLTDQGRNFSSKLLQEVCDMLGVKEGPPAQEVWDISAGDFGSLLLCDGPGHCPRLFHVGGEPTLASAAVIPIPEQVGHVFSVSLSGNVFMSLSDGGPSSATAAAAPEGFVAALHELSATERACYRELTCWLLGQHGASLVTFLGGRRDVGDLFVVSQLATHTQTFQK